MLFRSQRDQSYSCPLIIMLRGGLFTVFAYFSILFMDTFVKIAILGVIGFGNIGYQLMPLLLALISAMIFLFAAVFNAPTKQGLVSFTSLIIFYGGFFWFNHLTQFDESDGIYTPILYVFIIQIGMAVVSFLLRKSIKKEPLLEPPLWNISAKFKHIFRPRVILLFWLLATFELIAIFEGYSFFAFGPSAQTLTQIILDIALVAFVIIWVLCDRRLLKKEGK